MWGSGEKKNNPSQMIQMMQIQWAITTENCTFTFYWEQLLSPLSLWRGFSNLRTFKG